MPDDSEAVKYAVRFDYPEGPAYAGLAGGAAGWAPTLATAMLFDAEDRAEAMVNAYGQGSRKHARVVEVGVCEFCSAPAPTDQFHPYWHDEGSAMVSCDACLVVPES